ncbi:MAG: hypothetical protein ISR65_06380 [Bacteriovoracaceae bacterium]|nr:hypothetical protein [Bacteriovoracaceae bacterium]
MHSPEFKYAGDLNKIVEAALDNLGRDKSFLLNSLNGGREKKLQIDNLSFFEWYEICQILYLPLDCISFGYSKSMHDANIIKARGKKAPS